MASSTAAAVLRAPDSPLAWRRRVRGGAANRAVGGAGAVRPQPRCGAVRARPRTRCGGDDGGEPVVARPIDKRLDAVVASLPIREVLYKCLDTLEVRKIIIGTLRFLPCVYPSPTRNLDPVVIDGGGGLCFAALMCIQSALPLHAPPHLMNERSFWCCTCALFAFVTSRT